MDTLETLAMASLTVMVIAACALMVDAAYNVLAATLGWAMSPLHRWVRVQRLRAEIAGYDADIDEIGRHKPFDTNAYCDTLKRQSDAIRRLDLLLNGGEKVEA